MAKTRSSSKTLNAKDKVVDRKISKTKEKKPCPNKPNKVKKRPLTKQTAATATTRKVYKWKMANKVIDLEIHPKTVNYVICSVCRRQVTLSSSAVRVHNFRRHRNKRKAIPKPKLKITKDLVIHSKIVLYVTCPLCGKEVPVKSSGVRVHKRRFHSITEPNDELQPAITSHSPVASVQADVQISPVQADVQIAPVQADVQIAPVQADVQIEPVQAVVQIEPVQAVVQIEPVQAVVQMSPYLPQSSSENAVLLDKLIGGLQATLSDNSDNGTAFRTLMLQCNIALNSYNGKIHQMKSMPGPSTAQHFKVSNVPGNITDEDEETD